MLPRRQRSRRAWQLTLRLCRPAKPMSARPTRCPGHRRQHRSLPPMPDFRCRRRRVLRRDCAAARDGHPVRRGRRCSRGSARASSSARRKPPPSRAARPPIRWCSTSPRRFPLGPIRRGCASTASTASCSISAAMRPLSMPRNPERAAMNMHDRPQASAGARLGQPQPAMAGGAVRCACACGSHGSCARHRPTPSRLRRYAAVISSRRARRADKAVGLSAFERDCCSRPASARHWLVASSAWRWRKPRSHREQQPTFNFALQMLTEPHWDALSPLRPLRHWRRSLCGGREAPPRRRSSIDERVLHYLAGVAAMDARPLLGLVQAWRCRSPVSSRRFATVGGSRTRSAGGAARPPGVLLRGHETIRSARPRPRCGRAIGAERALVRRPRHAGRSDAQALPVPAYRPRGGLTAPSRALARRRRRGSRRIRRRTR